MKLGLVLECDAGGPDDLVLTCFARRLSREIDVESTALGRKEQLFLKGVETAVELVESSECDLVLIVWDLKPYWNNATPNCEAEAEELRDKLQAAHETRASKIKLLCLTWELETWLIADARAINAHLSTPEHKSKFKCTSPLTKTDAKAFLDGECRKHRGKTRRYVDFREAIQIAREIPDTSKVGRIPSFDRFSTLISGNAGANFQRPATTCDDLVYQAFQLGRA